ncbi:hypothetical protein ABTM77_20235, partial [Acinetobacter baumannii]
YWWYNIRNPVLFRQAVEVAIADGISHFIEIGPRSILTGAVKEILRVTSTDGQTIGTLTDRDPADVDPVRMILVRLIANGVTFDRGAVFGSW